MTGGTPRDPGEAGASTASGRLHAPGDAELRGRLHATGEHELRGGDPTRIGRFTVLERLGSGGMGLVYAGYDGELDRKVAIKLLRPHVVHSGRATLGQARLLREAQAMARLSHVNVVTVHEVGTHGDQVYIAMELLTGVTLKAWLRRAPRPWREVVAVLVQAGRGLAAAHAAGLIHRDFKPDNVMVTEDPATGRVERVRVFDFGVVQEFREAAVRHTAEHLDSSSGLRTPAPEPDSRRRSSAGLTSHDALGRARVRGLPSQSASGLPVDESPLPTPESSLGGNESLSDFASLTAAGALVGTPMYMAPEQYMQAADARSDQFSFCVALFEGLYRKRPFSGDNAASLQRAKLAGRLRRRPADTDVPMWLHQLVLRGLHSEPARRFPSMEALLRELERERVVGWRRALRPGLALAGALAAGAAAASLLAPEDRCAGAAAAVEVAWSAERRAEIEAAFAATGRTYAASTFANVDAALSRYAAAWSERRAQHCVVAGDAPASHLVSRGLCLELRLQEFSALTSLLARADAQIVDHAPMAVGRLTPVDHCDDVISVVARTPPAPGPELAGVEFTARLAEVRALEQSGKYALGLEAARAAVAEARRLAHPPWLAEALLLEGVLHARLSSLRAAESSLFDAAVVAEESRHDEVVALAFSELVRVVGVDLERYDEGLRWGQLADAALRRLGGGPPADAVALAGHLGHVYERRGDLPAAQVHYERAEDLARRTLPEDHPMHATVRMDLAGCQLARGRYAEAARIYEDALALRRAALGGEHPLVAEALTSLAVVAWERKDLDRAHALVREALAICDAPDRCSPAERARALVDLAKIEFTRGDVPAAQRLTERAVDIYESVYGDGHPRVAALWANLGVFAKNQGRHDEARVHYERALQLLRRRHAEDHPDIAAILQNLGTLAMDQGRWIEARDRFKAALAIYDRGGGHETYGLANLLDNDGVAALRVGDVAAALERHTRSLAIYQRDHSDSHPDVARVRTHLAEDHLAAGARERAAELAELGLASLVGSQSPELPRLRLILARALADRDRPRALQLASDALAELRADPDRAREADDAAAQVAALERRPGERALAGRAAPR